MLWHLRTRHHTLADRALAHARRLKDLKSQRDAADALRKAAEAGKKIIDAAGTGPTGCMLDFLFDPLKICGMVPSICKPPESKPLPRGIQIGPSTLDDLS
jgi:hypothetical protein